MSEQSTDKVYWAAEPEPKKMLEHAFKRIDAWFKHLRDDGVLSLWRLSCREYYAGVETGGEIGTEGEADEFTTIKINHYHSLGERVVTAIAGQPPTFQPQALNSDHESTVQTVIANGVLEQAVTQRGLDEFFPAVTRHGVVLGEGWGSVEWDANEGEDFAVDPATGQVVKSGEVRYRSFTPDCVIRDWNKETGQDHEWVITRRFENRWNVLAQAMASAQDAETQQAWRDRILAIPSKIAERTERPRISEPNNGQDESDDIAVYELRHAKTPALPGGRCTVFVDPEVWLKDGPLPYRDISVYRLAPEEQIGTEAGYSASFDLLAPQHAANAAYSTILSVQSALGHPMIWVGEGNNFSVEELKAYSILKGALTKPEAVTLANTPAEIPAFADKMVQQMEILSGVNAVARGNLDAAGKLSGAAYALIDAKFLESVVGLQRGYKTFAQKVATATIHCYQEFAKAEHTLRVVGKSNRAYVDKFTGDDLKHISRVDIEMGNPLSRTSSGRLQLAEMLMKVTDPMGKPAIKSPEQFMQVVTTGRIEPLTEGPAKELDNIKAENEQIGEGDQPVALIIDNHPLHIEEHSATLASPEARKNPAIVQAGLAHIQEHIQLWTTADPAALAARQIMLPPPPPPAPGVAPSGAPGETTGTPPPTSGGPPSVSAMPEPEGAAPGPGMPSMPTNPGTGEPAPMPAY